MKNISYKELINELSIMKLFYRDDMMRPVVLLDEATGEKIELNYATLHIEDDVCVLETHLLAHVPPQPVTNNACNRE